MLNAEAKLESQERTLQEKEAGIHAAALREKEIGKLIERLSSECEKLSAELCEKELFISRLKDTTRPYFFNGTRAWGKIPRVMQVGRLLFGQKYCSLATARQSFNIGSAFCAVVHVGANFPRARRKPSRGKTRLAAQWSWL